MKALLYIAVFLYSFNLYSQDQPVEDDENISESALEDLAQDDEAESENDYDLQQLAHFKKNPVNINSADISELPLLGPLQIDNLATYRALLGDLIDVYELQAVPGFDVALIKKILPYIIVKENVRTEMLRDRFIKGQHSFLSRFSLTPEKAAGFIKDQNGTTKFSGSRPAFFARYKYQYRNLMQFGLVTDKDPGEKMPEKKIPVDFSSFHLFIRKIGIIKSLALGDYTINLGQGLIHWQSQAFRKSSSVINIKRQSEVLKPYQSAGEYNFHRGIAATLEKGKWQGTLFLSVRKLSANIDVNTSGDEVITSIQTSGLHRTESEKHDRNVAGMVSAGSNVRQNFRGGHMALNTVCVKYSTPLLKEDLPYNLYALKGNFFLNGSFDYSYTYRNVHFFGELAVNKNLSRAIIAGMMSSLSKSADVALLFRDIGNAYNSVYGNAFTESTMPGNERGIYYGLSLKPSAKWKIDMYADIFSFPWLKYRLNAPSEGVGYLIQLTLKPDKRTELYSRFRFRMKPLNIPSDEIVAPGHEMIGNWRTHVSVGLTRWLTLRSRVELCIYDHAYLEFPASGYLFFTEILYKPFGFWLSGSVRFQAFEAENYDTRIYAFENDLLFVSATPSFYNNGVRYYLNLRAKLRLKWFSNKLLTLSLKAASTVYTNISSIGTGVSAIPGSRNSSIKLQFFLTE